MGECSHPHHLHTSSGILWMFFTQQIADNEWNDVTEGFYVLRKTKSPFPLVLTWITLVGLFQPLGFTSIK
jgi:hypothetical protein